MAVSYGSLLPGKLTYKEFVSGVLRPVPSIIHIKGWNASALYKDPAGNKMILLESHFRLPSDFHSLLDNKYAHDRNAR